MWNSTTSIGIGRIPDFHTGTLTNTNVNETANNSANATIQGGTEIQLRDSLRMEHWSCKHVIQQSIAMHRS